MKRLAGSLTLVAVLVAATWAWSAAEPPGAIRAKPTTNPNNASEQAEKDKRRTGEMVTRVYPIRHIFSGEAAEKPVAWQPPDERPRVLIDDVLQKLVEPLSWESVGGAGRIEFFGPNYSLVITQDQERHNEIATVLKALKNAREKGLFAPVATKPSTSKNEKSSGKFRLEIELELPSEPARIP